MMRSSIRSQRYFVIVCCLVAVLLCHVYPSMSVQTFGEAESQVYVGGFPIGLVLQPKGVIVVGAAPIETELGNMVAPSSLRAGDIIEAIDDKEILRAEDVRTALRETQEMTAQVRIRRGTACLDVNVPLILEDMTGEKRLGLQIRENIAGVGTVTYVREDGTFAALGHPITLDNGSVAPCFAGASFGCKILGCNRGTRGRAGELKGAFVGSAPSGTVYRNCISGIYGKLNAREEGEKVEVADRRQVKAGKAYILATVGERTEQYSIEIIKTTPQNSVSDKSMILRVTDKRLIAATGGIVQGMSGSPILQNGRLVGAVTHVFLSDPTKGYGIYADWILKNE